MSVRFRSRLLVGLLAGSGFFLQGQADVETRAAEAQALAGQGDLAGAAAKYEEIIKIDPKLGAAYNNLGALYYRQREYGKAVKTLESGLKVDPKMTSASALLGISLYEMADYGKARPALEAALRANPKDGNVQLFLARDLIKSGEFDGAATQLQRLTSRDPQNQEAWYLLAKLHMSLSEQALARMNAIDPNSPLSHELSAEVMESMNNYDGAVVELKKAVNLAPQRAGTHYKLGEAYFSLSQWDSAKDQYAAELALDPANCLAQWKVGSVLLQNGGDPQEAFNDVDKALTACPSLTAARVDRARALGKLNRNPEAVADLEAAVKANPKDPTIHFQLSKAYRAVGRAQESVTEMEAFRKLDEAARSAEAERAAEVIKNKQSAH
jgi:tetratricopeptide (TPR) repeat protein